MYNMQKTYIYIYICINSHLPQPYTQVTAGAKIWAALVAARTSWGTVRAPRDFQGWWRMSWTFLQGVLRPHPSVTWIWIFLRCVE